MTTRERLQELLAENPVRTLESLGQELGVSRERVRQICENWGLVRVQSLKYECRDCSMPIPSDMRPWCDECRVTAIAARVTVLTCKTCGVEFERATWDVRSKAKVYKDHGPFCSNQCNGVYQGGNYGWGATNSAKTHCPQGHPYDAENTYIQASTGGRLCRECGRRRAREYYHRNKVTA